MLRRVQKSWEGMRRDAKRWGEGRSEGFRSIEKRWEEVRWIEKRREKLRRGEKNWEKARKIEKGRQKFRMLRRAEESWNKSRWIGKGWEELRRVEKGWEKVRASSEKSSKPLTPQPYSIGKLALRSYNATFLSAENLRQPPFAGFTCSCTPRLTESHHDTWIPLKSRESDRGILEGAPQCIMQHGHYTYVATSEVNLCFARLLLVPNSRRRSQNRHRSGTMPKLLADEAGHRQRGLAWSKLHSWRDGREPTRSHSPQKPAKKTDCDHEGQAGTCTCMLRSQ